jgi:preprotein translocase subunit SecB
VFKAHAIQIKHLNFLTLSIVRNVAYQPEEAEVPPEFSLQTAHSDFDVESSEIAVKGRILIGYDEEGNKLDNAEFHLEVEVEGFFTVDLSSFPQEQIFHWAVHNAPYVLYPYLREGAYALTARLFPNAALLPLLEVPTVKLVKQ